MHEEQEGWYQCPAPTGVGESMNEGGGDSL